MCPKRGKQFRDVGDGEHRLLPLVKHETSGQKVSGKVSGKAGDGGGWRLAETC